MNGLLFIFAVLAYGLLLFVLFVYGVNFLYLAYLTWKKNSADPIAPPLTQKPCVGVHLPLFNELYVAERLIDAVAQLDWPPDRLEIQVLDDSTDETREIVRNAVERWR